MSPDLLYQLALTLVPHVGDVHARTLVQTYGSARAIFDAKKRELEKVSGVGSIRAQSIKDFNAFDVAEAEIVFLQKYKVAPLFITDPAYPRRLLHCYDAPPLLFYKGTADLNTSKIVGIVGTRSNTEYGKSFTEKLVHDLAHLPLLIASGLAYGIDAYAHKAALKTGLPTVGVVGHGLNTIYPSEHRGMAKQMVAEGGGLLTEFFSKTKPDKHHFPLRNRLVAGLCDAVILVETALQGGSMITAKLADAYNRDVFAVPGRTIDKASAGCNFLIRHNKAHLLTGAADFLEVMGWNEREVTPKKQRALFLELLPDEEKILQLLQEGDGMHIDEINTRSGLSSSAVAAAILGLELQGIAASLPGKLYKAV
jgi:DNA processing protein